MRQGIGETFTYNMIIIFIIIVFGILSATISYYKAYKVNARILASIEKFEGYNELARTEIDNTLKTIGYTPSDGSVCAASRGKGKLEPQDSNFFYCVYYFNNDTPNDEKNKDGEFLYYNYSVVSYIYVELPIVGAFKIPVHTKGERTYNFSDRGGNAA